MIPVLKWAGGKRQIINLLDEIILPHLNNNNTLYEPFVGGGSVFMSLNHHSVVINDSNSELINTYLQIRDNPEELIQLLYEHNNNHNHDYYYFIRNQDRLDDYNNWSPVQKAARTIYLNRTCFNGLYRVNRDGFFNVPLGSYVNPQIIRENEIRELSEYLNNNHVTIQCGDFTNCTDNAHANDVVYFDPPYDYIDDGQEGFVRYTAEQFDHTNLRSMAEMCEDLRERGCFVVVSNNDTPFVRECFPARHWTIKKITGRRMINNTSMKRRGVGEVIIIGEQR